MTKEEIELFEATGELVNKFFALEPGHSHDGQEFVFHIHAIQNIILSREGLRTYNIEIARKMNGNDLVMILERSNKQQERRF